jgi:protein LSM14
VEKFRGELRFTNTNNMTTEIPFIGCEISLISKSEIRYKGTLTKIDAKEHTVSLSAAVSYGTENRPSQKRVEPSNEIYEFIIFRGADIKDLKVTKNSKRLIDPAIVEIGRMIVEE